jgi:dimethylaniline monooxygenase (N-oxide forming)
LEVFQGFDAQAENHNEGAIPPMAEMQAMLWVALLQKRIPTPKVEPVYRLLASKSARIQYGVRSRSFFKLVL